MEIITEKVEKNMTSHNKTKCAQESIIITSKDATAVTRRGRKICLTSALLHFTEKLRTKISLNYIK